MNPRLLMLIAAMSSSCRATPTQGNPPTRLEPQPAPLAPPRASASSSASSASSSEAPPPAAPSAEPPRAPLPIVATSPGKIDCETVECDARSEICCELYGSPVRKCVAKSDPAGCATVEALWKSCDELADCGDSEVCCYVARPDPSSTAMQVCRKKSCNPEESEACLPGGKCSGKKRCEAAAPGQRFSFCQ